jgi:Domain of unknown function (DUF4136)
MKPQFVFLALFLLVSVNLFAIKVSYDYDPSFDFSKFRTYQLIDVKDSKVDPLTDQKIKQAINNTMSKKGFSQDDSSPDLYLAYQFGVQKEQRVNPTTAVGWGWFPWDGPGMGMATAPATTSTIDIGTLVINLVNASNKKLVFRSQGTDTLDPSKDSGKNYQKIQQAVEKILNHFPPKPKK